MNKVITNAKLLAMRNDINKQVMGSITFSYFHQQKIKNFYQQNQLRLQLIDEKIQKLIDTYVLIDEKRKPLIKEGEYQFENDQNKENYVVEYKEFMERNITLHS